MWWNNMNECFSMIKCYQASNNMLLYYAHIIYYTIHQPFKNSTCLKYHLKMSCGPIKHTIHKPFKNSTYLKYHLKLSCSPIKHTKHFNSKLKSLLLQPWSFCDYTFNFQYSIYFPAIATWVIASLKVKWDFDKFLYVICLLVYVCGIDNRVNHLFCL